MVCVVVYFVLEFLGVVVLLYVVWVEFWCVVVLVVVYLVLFWVFGRSMVVFGFVVVLVG